MAKRRIGSGLCQCGCGKQTAIAKKDNPSRGLIKGQFKPFWRGHQARQGLMSFHQAREFVRALRLQSVPEYNAFCKSDARPKTLPTAPYRIYKKDWAGWGDFLGNEFLRFDEARELVRSLNLKSETEWRVFVRSGKKPNNIPADPTYKYANEWAGWGDFLGTGNVQNGKQHFLAFEEARKFVHALSLKNQQEWHAHCKSGNNPANIPTNPQNVYSDQWLGWADWLGYLGSSVWTAQAIDAFLRSVAPAHVAHLILEVIAENSIPVTK